jgi:nucleoid-associated protein YejK
VCAREHVEEGREPSLEIQCSFHRLERTRLQFLKFSTALARSSTVRDELALYPTKDTGAIYVCLGTAVDELAICRR